MTLPQLIVAAGKEKALQRRHPWLFSGAVARIEGKPREGDVVEVVDANGHWLATGHYQEGTIACKILSFNTRTLDRDFFRRRIRSAIAYRERMGFFAMPDTNVFRLVHAEGDFLPGLICDWYNGVLVMQAHSVGMHRLFPLLAELFVSELTQYGLVSIFDKSSATLPTDASDGYIWGNAPQEWEFSEWGNRMVVNFYEGQKTGFFIDQRDNRHLVADLASGHSVLNCFGYTGGFSLGALRGGAHYVETVDISRKAIALCEKNVALNFGTKAPHKGVVADVLKYLDGNNQHFDFIILDPPAFAKSHHNRQQGLKGYRTINQRAIEMLPSGGLLMTFSCSQAISVEDFRTMVFTSAALAKRQVRVVRTLPHAADHPVSIYHPEGEYLKGLLLQVE